MADLRFPEDKPSVRQRRDEYERFGFRFAWGAFTALWVIFAFGTVGTWALMNLAPAQPVDATDQSAAKRSSFTLLTDYGTGCQYLKNGSGLTPRLDATGKQMCGAR